MENLLILGVPILKHIRVITICLSVLSINLVPYKPAVDRELPVTTNDTFARISLLSNVIRGSGIQDYNSQVSSRTPADLNCPKMLIYSIYLIIRRVLTFQNNLKSLDPSC